MKKVYTVLCAYFVTNLDIAFRLGMSQMLYYVAAIGRMKRRNYSLNTAAARCFNCNFIPNDKPEVLQAFL